MEQTPKYPAVRPAGREHIPLFPPYFIAIRFVQLVLAILTLCVTAYAFAYTASNYGYGALSGAAYMLVVALLTINTSIYHVVAEFRVPIVYNYWAVMVLDIVLPILWISSMGLTLVDTITRGSYDQINVSLYIATGFGGLEFLLYVTSLVIHAIAVYGHRKAGLPCDPFRDGAADRSPRPVQTDMLREPMGVLHPHHMYPHHMYPQHMYPHHMYPYEMSQGQLQPYEMSQGQLHPHEMLQEQSRYRAQAELPPEWYGPAEAMA